MQLNRLRSTLIELLHVDAMDEGYKAQRDRFRLNIDLKSHYLLECTSRSVHV